MSSRLPWVQGIAFLLFCSGFCAFAFDFESQWVVWCAGLLYFCVYWCFELDVVLFFEREVDWLSSRTVRFVLDDFCL